MTITMRQMAEWTITAAVVVTTGAYLWWILGPRPELAAKIPTPTEPLAVADAPSKGRTDAPVVLVEFSDFQCPFCARVAAETLDDIEREYVDTGKITFAYRHTPLTGVHPLAVRAAEAAECAGRQGRFWEMHDQLFAGQRQISEQTLRAWGGRLDLDTGRYERCLGGEAAARVTADIELSERLSVRSTPAFMVGRRQADGRVKVLSVIDGAATPQRFRTAIDAALDADPAVALAR